MNAWISAADSRRAEGRYLEASELIKRAAARSHVLLGPRHPLTDSLLESYDDAYRRHLDEENRESLTRLREMLNEKTGTVPDQRIDPPADE
ncbi:hypothetical protein [Nocardia sp. NPDC051750]|uniref:hypothetical protein n=1 Tax=Nocardia sp. NPDC051750 TaxID=3364325 RepID=UPI0037AA4D3E